MEKITFDFSAEINKDIVLLVAIYKLGYKFEIKTGENAVEHKEKIGVNEETGEDIYNITMEYVPVMTPNPETPEQFVERNYKTIFEAMLKSDFAFAAQRQVEETAKNINIFK